MSLISKRTLLEFFIGKQTHANSDFLKKMNVLEGTEVVHEIAEKVE